MKKLVLIAALVPLLVLMGSSAHSQIIEEIPYPSPTPVQRTPSPSPTQTPVASPTPVVSPSPIASPSPSPSPSPAARLSFQIKCRIELSGVNGGSTVRGQTNIFDFIPGSGFSDADVSIVFGTYTVYAGVTLGQPYGSTSFEPTLNVELYHGGDPVGGMENMTALQGLSLETWAIGRAQTLIGTKFLRDQRGAGGFSRTDYACALTRIR